MSFSEGLDIPIKKVIFYAIFIPFGVSLPYTYLPSKLGWRIEVSQVASHVYQRFQTQIIVNIIFPLKF